METCYLGVGANLGNRRKNILLAIEKLNRIKNTKVLKASKLIETEAVGGPKGQPKYLNGALKIRTALTPSVLLKALKKIEKEIGRTPSVRWGPRLIDLDILLYGDKLIRTKYLEVPHPYMFKRDFVLEPLRQII